MRSRLTFALALVVILAGAHESRALFGRDDIVYPLRYEVRGIARFVGARTSGEIPEQHDVRARKVERDVLSIDGPSTFHWEKLLRDGTPLEGTYQEDDDEPGRLELHAFTSSHEGLHGAKFPFDRPNGVVRMNATDLVLREDLSRIHGRSAYSVRQEGNDHLRGRSGFRFKGKRL